MLQFCKEVLENLLGDSNQRTAPSTAIPTSSVPTTSQFSQSFRTPPTVRMPGVASPPHSPDTTHLHHRRPRESTRKRCQRSSLSEDERRLCPDYSVPADAVPLPPASAWAYGQEPDMSKIKPGGSRSFRPVDTLARDIPRAGGNKPRTYGTPGKSIAAHSHLDFLDREAGRAFENDQQPPPKRRKVDAPPASAQVENSQHGDDGGFHFPPSFSASSRSPRAPRTATSVSQHSGDFISGSQRKLSTLSPSGFANTNNIVNPRRARARRQRPDSDSLSVAAGSRRGSDHHRAIDLSHEEDELHGDGPAVTSKHFGAPTTGSGRMNPTTKPHDRTARDFSGAITTNMRDKIWRVPDDDPTDDRDELAGPLDTAPVVPRPRSPSKRMAHSDTSGNAAAARKAKNLVQPVWPLLHAISQGLSIHGEDLRLVQGHHEKLFNLQRVKSPARHETTCTLDLTKFHTSWSDGAHYIRLSGSLSANGAQDMFHLHFLNEEDCKDFRENHVKTAVLGDFSKDTDWMAKAFNKDLGRLSALSSPVGTSAIAHYPQVAERGTSRTMLSSTPTFDRMKSSRAHAEGTRAPFQSERNIKSRSSHPFNVALSRPVRSTRNSKTYAIDEPESVDREEPVKYSIRFGLGKRWSRDVQYGSGRLRALVCFDDLFRLDEGECLNDALIEFYMIYLLNQANIPKDSVYVFNTHFYQKLTQPVPGQKNDINYDGVKRWTAKEDIFKYDYILVPVCEGSHWYLAIICNVSNISRKPILDGFDGSSSVAEPSSDVRIDPNGQVAEHGGTGPTEEPLSKTSHPVIDLAGNDSILIDEELHEQGYPNAEDKVSELNTPAISVGTEPVREVSATEDTAGLEKLSLDDSIPKGIIGDVPSSPGLSKKGGRRVFGKRLDTEEPIILILDSLGLTHPKTTKALKRYIVEEGRDKRSMETAITQNVLNVKDAHIPMQPNYTDCGVYLLAYVQKFLQDPRQFVTQILTREMDSKKDWPEMSAPKLRDTMREILQKLSEAQHEEAKAQKKAKTLQKVNSEAAPVETNPPPVPEHVTATTTERPPADADTSPARVKPLLKKSEPVLGSKAPQPTTLFTATSREQLPVHVEPSSEKVKQLPVEPASASGSQRESARISSSIQLKSLSDPGSIDTMAHRSQESALHRTPRKTSPRVVIQVPSPEKRGNQTRRRDDTSAPNRRGQRSGKGDTVVVASGRPSAPSVAVLKGACQSAQPTEVIDVEPAPRSPPTPNAARGSSAAPIEIEDSQDARQPGPASSHAVNRALPVGQGHHVPAQANNSPRHISGSRQLHEGAEIAESSDEDDDGGRGR